MLGTLLIGYLAGCLWLFNFLLAYCFDSDGEPTIYTEMLAAEVAEHLRQEGDLTEEQIQTGIDLVFQTPYFYLILAIASLFWPLALQDLI
jgi:hypothetical protein